MSPGKLLNKTKSNETEKNISRLRQEALPDGTDELADRLDEVEDRLESGESSEVEELRDEVEDVKSRMNDLMDYVEDRTVTKSDVRRIVNVELETWDEPESTEELRPSQVDDGMMGSRVKVTGDLEFQKKTKEAHLYTLKGGSGWIIVRSGEELDADTKCVTGQVSELQGNLYIEA